MATTSFNEFSSRSHAILQFSIIKETTLKINSDDPAVNKIQITKSKLYLVDLAGSERAAVTENKVLFKYPF